MRITNINNTLNISKYSTNKSSNTPSTKSSDNFKSTFTGTPAISILSKLLKIFHIKPTTPMERAAKYMAKGNRCGDLKTAEHHYYNAATALINELGTLPLEGLKQYGWAMKGLTKVRAATSTIEALNTQKRFFSSIIETAQKRDVDTIAGICKETYQLGLLAIKRGNLIHAGECFAFSRDVAQYMVKNKIARPNLSGHDFLVHVNRQIEAIAQLSNT